MQPVRPKNCPHRYCMRCFRKCFQDKQEKHCATCRTPILSVSKRRALNLFHLIGFLFSALFACSAFAADDCEAVYYRAKQMFEAFRKGNLPQMPV